MRDRLHGASLPRSVSRAADQQQRATPRVQDMPDVMRAWQRKAGNRAVTAMLRRSPRAALQRRPPGPTAPREIPFDPKAHPEWPLFRASLLAAKLPASEIESLWGDVLWGVAEQDPAARAWAFAGAAENLRHLLRLSPGRPMAFWTGGVDVSRYAQRRGFSTLEHTVAGRVFQSLELYHDWGVIGEFWDQLSRVFAEAARGEVHVFMRTHDPKSTLLNQEVPGIKALEDRDIRIRWHVLFGEELDEIREIDADGQLVDDASFDDAAKARMALKNFIVSRLQKSDEPSTAADKMKLR